MTNAARLSKFLIATLCSSVSIFNTQLKLHVAASSDQTPTLNEPFQTELKSLPHAPCVSLFHRNGRIGCGTVGRDEMTGTLLHWTTLTSDNYYSSAMAQISPFVAVLDEFEYTSDVIDQISSFSSDDGTALVQGILILNSTSSASYLNAAPVSPKGQNTPSYQLTPGYDYEWNANGDGLMLKDMYGIPSGFLGDEEIATYILQVSKDQSSLVLASASKSSSNNDGSSGGGGFFTSKSMSMPPVVAEFNMYMGPQNIDTASCLSWIDNDDIWRPKCLPLGGNSVWATAGSPYQSTNNDNNNGNNDDGGDGKTPIIMVATNLDSTSMFHDRVPGANTAAANILTVLMAAKLIGSSLPDDELDGLNKKIMFAFFQGEQYGYLGSRSFLRDVAYPGFECDDGRTVAAVAKKKDEGDVTMACLSPLRHDLAFADLGDIESMIAVDQIGILSDENTFYVHDSGAGDGLSDIFTGITLDDWNVVDGSAESIPPTPLSSLYKLSGGTVGGVVLSGYDATFAANTYYLSHMDSNYTTPIDLQNIAKAATFVARAALTAAYGGDGDDDGGNFAANAIAELSYDDETLVDLADCLFTNGRCDTLSKYSKVERVNNREETGQDVGIGADLGSPPNYYVSVYNNRNGQAFAYIDGSIYGSYTGDEEYGKNSGDAVLVRPNVLEMSIHGLLNDFLGRGSYDESSEDNEYSFKSCQASSDCSDVTYCSSSGDLAVCTGGNECVCSRSHYHLALDEAIIPAPNNYTGMFMVSEDDEGVSPMYSEPYWSNDIGIHIYRDGGENGAWVISFGLIVAGAWLVGTTLMKSRLRKEKLY